MLLLKATAQVQRVREYCPRSHSQQGTDRTEIPTQVSLVSKCGLLLLQTYLWMSKTQKSWCAMWKVKQNADNSA